MAGFQKSIAINAPVEKVFDFVKYPRNLPEIWSSLVEVRDVKQNPDRGFNYGWVYKMEDQNLKEHLKSLNISPTNGLQPGAAKASTTALAGHLKKQIMAAAPGSPLTLTTPFLSHCWANWLRLSS